MPLCDTVLHLASHELFEPYCSDSIPSEVGRTLEKFGKTPEQIARRLSRRAPDEFLMNVLGLFPMPTLAAIRRQANALRRENGLDDVVRKLALQVPQFAEAIENLIRAGA